MHCCEVTLEVIGSIIILSIKSKIVILTWSVVQQFLLKRAKRLLKDIVFRIMCLCTIGDHPSVQPLRDGSLVKQVVFPQYLWAKMLWLALVVFYGRAFRDLETPVQEHEAFLLAKTEGDDFLLCLSFLLSTCLKQSLCVIWTIETLLMHCLAIVALLGNQNEALIFNLGCFSRSYRMVLTNTEVNDKEILCSFSWKIRLFYALSYIYNI